MEYKYKRRGELAYKIKINMTKLADKYNVPVHFYRDPLNDNFHVSFKTDERTVKNVFCLDSLDVCKLTYEYMPKIESEVSRLAAERSINKAMTTNYSAGITRTYARTGSLPCIKKVIYNNPATIVFWSDGTKTVVKASNESYDPEKGLAMAISKKVLGNQGNYFNEFKKWLKDYHK